MDNVGSTVAMAIVENQIPWSLNHPPNPIRLFLGSENSVTPSTFKLVPSSFAHGLEFLFCWVASNIEISRKFLLLFVSTSSSDISLDFVPIERQSGVLRL
jgi:hypothetical protein